MAFDSAERPELDLNTGVKRQNADKLPILRLLRAEVHILAAVPQDMLSSCVPKTKIVPQLRDFFLLSSFFFLHL